MIEQLTKLYTFCGITPSIIEDNDRVIFKYDTFNRHIKIEVSDELIYERNTCEAIKNSVTEWLNG